MSVQPSYYVVVTLAGGIPIIVDGAEKPMILSDGTVLVHAVNVGYIFSPYHYKYVESTLITEPTIKVP